MSEGGPLVNIPDLSRPATVLIQKVSNAIGSLIQPYQMQRIADAQVKVDKIRALGKIEVSDLERRAITRLVEEEGKRQHNIEEITKRAIELVEAEADPARVDEDWIAHLFEKCRIVSNTEMQTVWARILAGEANAPGTFSRRTLDLVGSLERPDADLFTALCRFVCRSGAHSFPLVYDVENDVYVQHGVTFTSLNHLASLGLVTFGGATGYVKKRIPRHLQIAYHTASLVLEFPLQTDNTLQIGKVLLTQAGEELAPISGARPVERFVDYVCERWLHNRLVLSSPLKAHS